jgi:predicted ATPase/DNA-binding CsgD family transcriptional regulator
LSRWFHAAYLTARTRGVISAEALERELGLTRKTVCRMRELLNAALAMSEDGARDGGSLRLHGVNLSFVLIGADVTRPGSTTRRAGAAASGSAEAGADHLPLPHTRFIGRRREIAAVRRQLARSRLVTLVGSGGCGKSRIAIQVGRSLLNAYADGVWWVDLQRLARGQAVAAAVTETLGVREQPGCGHLEALRRRLRGCAALIVMDNCEHVIEASAEVIEALLDASPDVRVLATSRETIGFGGEAICPIPPLPYPASHTSLAQVAKNDAIRLFVDRASAALPSFRLDESNAQAVVSICAQLDGIPLAIELATAAVAALGPFEIALALDDCLRVLTRTSPIGPSRHRSLRASLEWSHALLTLAEQTVFRRLAAFPGTFSPEAARTVCGFASVDQRDVTGVLMSLMHKSLVTVVGDGSMRRYRLLEVVRQYALEHLGEAGETLTVRDRHLEYAVALVEREQTRDLLSERRGGLDLLEEERGNLRSALDWAIANGHPDAPLRLAARLGSFFSIRAHLAEGRRFLEDALTAGASVPSVARAQALWGSAYVAFHDLDISAARDLATAALETARAVDDRQTVGRSLAMLGGINAFRRPRQAREHLTEAISVAQAVGDNWGLAQALGFTSFSWVAQNCLEPARRYAAEAGRLVEHLGAHRFRAWHRLGVGIVAIRAGDIAGATAAVVQANLFAAEIGDPLCQARTMRYRTEIACWQGQATMSDVRRAVERLDIEFGLISRGPTIATSVHIAKGTCALALGQLAEAETELGRALVITERSFAPEEECVSALGLAGVALLRNQPDKARTILQRVFRRAEELDDTRLTALARVSVARLSRMSGDVGQAIDLCCQSLALQRDGGYLLDAIITLEAIAGLYVHRGEHIYAARLFSAATAARRHLGARRSRLDKLHDRDDRTTLARAVEPAALRTALREGRTLELPDAVAYVLRGRGGRGRPSHGWQSLTPTEMAVARLVAEGWTNPAIARRMFISRTTVKTHLAHIFYKTGLANRTELATEVTRRTELPETQTLRSACGVLT